MASETKNYEIAYLISSQIPEEEVLTWAGKLTILIENSHGIIHHVEEPKKRKLSYPVKKERSAYFAYTTFAMPKNHLGELRKKLKSGSAFLRYLVVEEVPHEPERIPLRPPKRGTAAPRKIEDKTAVASRAEEKLDIAALDKKLEEILGK